MICFLLFQKFVSVCRNPKVFARVRFDAILSVRTVVMNRVIYCFGLIKNCLRMIDFIQRALNKDQDLIVS